jgi:hypothetical protein
MEPNVKTAFDAILKRIDSINGRCGRLEKTTADSESARKEQGSASERRIAEVEEALSELVEVSKGQIRGMEEFPPGLTYASSRWSSFAQPSPTPPSSPTTRGTRSSCASRRSRTAWVTSSWHAFASGMVRTTTVWRR